MRAIIARKPGHGFAPINSPRPFQPKPGHSRRLALPKCPAKNSGKHEAALANSGQSRRAADLDSVLAKLIATLTGQTRPVAVGLIHSPLDG